MMAWNALVSGGSVLLFAGLFAACSSGDVGGSTEGSGGGMGGGGAVVASSSTIASSSVSSSSSSGSGGGPIMCTDTYTNIPTGQCDLLQQDCQPGFTCAPAQSGGNFTTSCVAAAGLKGLAAACMANDECQAGLFCIFDKCTPVCCPSEPSTCGGGTCNVDVSLGMGYVMRVCAFPQSCELFMPGTCPPGEECHLGDTMQGLSVCIAPSGPNQVDEGMPCMYLNDCKEMQMCVGGTCRYNCDLATWQQKQPGLGGCPTGRMCADPSDPNFKPDTVGICIP